MVKKKLTKQQQHEQQQKEEEDKREQALEYYNNTPGASIRSVAKKFDIPYSTFNDLVSGKSSINSHAGRHSYFTDTEECELKQWIFDRNDNNLPVNEHDVINKANKMYEYKYHKPISLSDGWYQNFRSRHSDIAVREAERLEQVRSESENVQVVESFFDQLEDVIKENKLKPDHIYNCDETGIQRNETTGYTLAKKGSHPSMVTPSSRETCSILVCGNAAGSYVPPLFIYKGKSVSEDMFNDSNTKATVYATDNGFITTNCFLSWMMKNFIEHIPASRPVLLLYDNHTTHCDSDVLEYAKKNDIIIMAIPPHLSHLYQPLDVGVFSSMKQSFKHFNTEFMKENISSIPSKKDFTKMLHDAYEESAVHHNIVSGFRESCIVPLDKKSALAKIQHSKNGNQNERPPSKFGNLFNEPPKQTKEKIRVKTNSVLTSDDFIKKAKEQKTEKLEKKRKLEERKHAREEKKKTKIETGAQKKLLKKQKQHGVVCSCHHACGSNRTCKCKLAGKMCTMYCTCHGKCAYTIDINPISTPSASSSQNICCYSQCKFKDDHDGMVTCSTCKKLCHSKTCTMPSTETINGKEITNILCIDCGEKEP